MRFLKGCKLGALPNPTGKRVSIIGAGPAGLGAAGVLICKGHEVVIYDQLPEAGGLLIFGIPDFRIPKKRIRDGIKEMKDAGVKIILNKKVGRDVDLESIIDESDSVLIATGTWRSRELKVPGCELDGIHTAFDYIVNYHLYKYGYINTPPEYGKKALVIGGGLTAVDMCYIAKEVGCEEIYLSYRRTRQYAPAGKNEFNQLEKEGVKILELTQPTKFIGHSRVEKVVLIRNKLVETGEGRPKPQPILGSDIELEVDIVFQAIGEIPTPPFENGKYGIHVNSDGTIYTDEHYRTTRKGVFAAGDVKTGPSLIGPALASGKKAGEEIHNYLLTDEWPDHLLKIGREYDRVSR